MGDSTERIEDILNEAVRKMEQKGYRIKSTVEVCIDPRLEIMGYAKKEGEKSTIYVSAWARNSGMLYGLILHELAHIYFTENNFVTHDTRVLERVIHKLEKYEGLRRREREYLIEAYSHLQNIIVDDVVFDVIEGEMLEKVKRFFYSWIREKTTGDQLADAAALCRNAFAIASLKRRNLFDETGVGKSMNSKFLQRMGKNADKEYRWIEDFLVNAKEYKDEKEFERALEEYFIRIIGLMRAAPWIEDMK